MAQTTPPIVDPLPPAPNTSSPSTFAALSDAFLTALITLRTQLVALASNVYDNAVDAFNNATAAAASALAAAGSASAAASAGNAVIWVSGATVALGATVLSPADSYRPYKRITATGSGITDPKNDTTNYAPVNFVQTYLRVSDQKPSGTQGGSSVGLDITQTRTLNTVEVNTISGASLASDSVTIPAGTYRVSASAPFFTSAASKIFLYNTIDSAYTVIGQSAAGGSGNSATLSGQFTITAQKTFKLRYYTSNSAATTGLGISLSSGQVEVYAHIEFTKVA